MEKSASSPRPRLLRAYLRLMSRIRIRRSFALCLCVAGCSLALAGCDATTVQDPGSAPGGALGGSGQQTSLATSMRTAYQTANLLRIEAGGYPPLKELASRLMESEPGNAFIPLAKAAGVPGRPEVIGVWTDGDQRVVMSAITKDGRTLRLEAKGDQLTSNF